MRRLAVAGALVAGLASAPALAQTTAWQKGVDGVGHITAMGGWKFTPNDYFFNSEANAGNTVFSKGIGGGQGALSFGYGATSFIEATIDAFLGSDRLTIANYEPISVLTYGALLGVTFTKMDLLTKGLWASIGIQLGPTLGFVTSPGINSSETLSTAYTLNASVGYRITETIGLQVHYRLMLARGQFEGHGINIGGSWVSVGVVLFFPRDASADLPAGT